MLFLYFVGAAVDTVIHQPEITFIPNQAAGAKAGLLAIEISAFCLASGAEKYFAFVTSAFL